MLDVDAKLLPLICRVLLRMGEEDDRESPDTRGEMVES
jgi:hypothetical protein